MFSIFKRFFLEKQVDASKSEGPPRAGRSRPEKGVSQGNEQFSQLVENVRDYAVLLLDREGNILTWNAGAERIKGYRAEEIIGENIRCFYPKDAVSSGWPAHELKMAGETGRFEDEGWRIRKDRTKFWASVVITALRDDSGAVRGYLKITRDLTDRRQNEEKLRLSEERFRLLIESVSDYAIYMLDPHGHIATWNLGAERLKQYTSDEIIGTHFSRFYPPDAIERGWPEEELKRATVDGRFEDEGWRIRKDGTRFWANVIITALRDDKGALVGFGKVTRDLTARRQAEENNANLLKEAAAREAAEFTAGEIEKQREQLHVTLASIGDAVIVTDEDGKVTFLNSVAANLTGWKTEEAAGNSLEAIFTIIHEETRVVIENPVAQAFRERSVVLLANHTSLLSRRGDVIPIEDSAAPIWDRHGNICGAVLVFRDVTEARKSVDARLRLAAIVESSDDAIIGKNLDGTISSWNLGAERLYGYTADEMIGQSLSILIPQDHPEELPDLMDKIRRGESIQHYETVRLRKDGSRVEVSLSISPVKNADGKITGASKIARDITARKDEDRRKSEFLALLAHELRNPLAPLRNTLQILKMAKNDEKTLEDARGMMDRQLQHLVRLVDDLLDVSRINQGKLQLRKERISIKEIVENTLEVCGQTVKEQGHPLTVKVPDEPIYFDADRTRIAQALCNLLNNAVKYSDRDTPIELSAEKVEDQIVIRVKDAGIGIPPEMLTKVFGMFTQIDPSIERSQGGLGIGLSIVKSLVEMHGGSVDAHSGGLGKGSEFSIRLPISQSTSKCEPVAQKGKTIKQHVSRRVLVVDDNVDSATSMAMMLRLMGNDVQTAHDGLAAIDVADSMHPDLVLLDIGMPNMNGYETCRRMRERNSGHSMKIVALTGWGQEEDKRNSQEAGFDGHLVKPIEFEAIENLFNSLIRGESQICENTPTILSN